MAVVQTVDGDASEESLGALLAKRRLSQFIRQSWHVLEPDTEYLHNWHIDLIAEHLEAITAGENTRLIVNIPPRYMKSTVITVMWPCWEWLRNPSQRWLFASYAQTLSLAHSLARRNLIRSPWYQARWHRLYSLSGDQNAKIEYQNDRAGHMISTSVGGGVIGRGGNRIVIDDPHNPEQAQSDVEREVANRYFDSSLYSRLDDKKRGAIILVMQRLHQRDLTGHLLANDPDGWVHLSLPGIAEEDEEHIGPITGKVYRRKAGEPLWKEREDIPTLERTRRAMTPVRFAGQYQQRPAPPGGNMLPREKFTIVAAPPARVRARIRYWDKAGTEGGTGACSAGVKMSIGLDGVWYIEDVRRGRWGMHDRERMMKTTAQLDGRAVEVGLEQEPGSGGKDSAAISVRELAGWDVFVDRVTGSKEVRAGPLAAQVQAGNVRLVAGAWNEDFLAEAEFFPNGATKDQIDAASGAFNRLSTKHGGSGFIAAAGPSAGRPRI